MANSLIYNFRVRSNKSLFPKLSPICALFAIINNSTTLAFEPSIHYLSKHILGALFHYSRMALNISPQLFMLRKARVNGTSPFVHTGRRCVHKEMIMVSCIDSLPFPPPSSTCRARPPSGDGLVTALAEDRAQTGKTFHIFAICLILHNLTFSSARSLSDRNAKVPAGPNPGHGFTRPHGGRLWDKVG